MIDGRASSPPPVSLGHPSGHAWTAVRATRRRSRWGSRLLGLLLTTAAILGCARRGPRDVHGRSEPEVLDAGLHAAVISVADAGAGRGDTGKKPVEIAQASARAIVTSATHVYFGDGEDDALYALAKDRGDGPTKIARRAPMPGALAIDTDGSDLAWVGSPGDVVLRVSTGGGSPTTVRDRGLFTDVAMSGGDVFFTEARDGGGVLSRVTGTTAARLASVEGSPRGIAVDEHDVYVATTSRLAAVPRTRGDVVELARGVGFASPQLDGRWLYATALDPKTRARVVVRVKKAGGALETVARSVRDAPIAAHDGVLYWFDADRPALLSSSAEPPFTPRIVSEAPLLERPSALAVDGDGVFVATGYGAGARVVVVPTR